jgi:hypothetical protein
MSPPFGPARARKRVVDKTERTATAPLVGRRCTLEQANEAVEASLAGSAGRVVVIPVT